MRMVVLFENCVLKVELHTRFIKLRVSESHSHSTALHNLLTLVSIVCKRMQRELSLRKQEYERLCYREKQLLSKIKSNTTTTSGTPVMNEVNVSNEHHLKLCSATISSDTAEQNGCNHWKRDNIWSHCVLPEYQY
jgi:hypothetical protein